jgi:hypothetical protein
MSNILYRGASSFDFLISIFWRAACIVGIIFLAYYYEENPPVIIVCWILCFLFFIVIGNDEITVYSDKIVQTDTSILNFILRSKGRVYDLGNIKAASLPENKLPNLFEAGIIAALVAFLPKRSHRNNQNKIFLDLKDGETITILSDLGDKKVKEIVKAVNSVI